MQIVGRDVTLPSPGVICETTSDISLTAIASSQIPKRGCERMVTLDVETDNDDAPKGKEWR